MFISVYSYKKLFFQVTNQFVYPCHCVIKLIGETDLDPMMSVCEDSPTERKNRSCNRHGCSHVNLFIAQIVADALPRIRRGFLFLI
jgi:hypothetical protein